MAAGSVTQCAVPGGRCTKAKTLISRDTAPKYGPYNTIDVSVSTMSAAPGASPPYLHRSASDTSTPQCDSVSRRTCGATSATSCSCLQQSGQH